jgi:hypothetical protein
MLDDSTSCNLNASPICSCKKWQKVADKENCETTTKLYEIRGRIDISGTLLQMMVGIAQDAAVWVSCLCWYIGS